jgi:hypothetical protein
MKQLFRGYLGLSIGILLPRIGYFPIEIWSKEWPNYSPVSNKMLIYSFIFSFSSLSLQQVGNGQHCSPLAGDGPNCGHGAICVNGICIFAAKPGQSCAQGQQCLGQSFCGHNRICQCLELELKMPVGGECVDRLKSPPGFPCGNGGGKIFLRAFNLPFFPFIIPKIQKL